MATAKHRAIDHLRHGKLVERKHEELGAELEGRQGSPEAELAAYIAGQAEAVGDTDRVIFNFHVPPHDTPIDQAALLDAEFRPIMKGGMPVISGVGSTAVRDALAKYQPMLSLHGHIHESRGEARIGRTLAINPGSEYSEGVLRGAIITLSRKKGVRGYQLVAG